MTEAGAKNGNPRRLAKTSLLRRNTAILVQNIHPCIFWTASLPCKLVAAWNQRHPCQVQKLTSLSIFEREFLLCKNVATAYNHGHPRPKMNILVHFWAASLQANLLLRGTSGIRAASAYPALLQIGGADARSLAEIKRRRICDTLSGGTDAAGYIRSDVSAMLKLAAKSVQGCTLLARQRSRCPAYLQKLLFPDLKNPRLLRQLFDKFIGRGNFQLGRALHLIDGIVIGNMDKNIASALRAEEEILERLEL